MPYMTKKMEENMGGFFIFGTDIASEGLLLAGNLYQKWENICQDNILVQDSSKLVDAVSEQFRKICEEVADDWLNPFSDGCVKGPVSDLSLEQDVIADICKKSGISHDESPINEGPLISISSEEVKSVAPLPIIGEDETKGACEIHKKKITIAPAEVKGFIYSGEKREDHGKVSPEFANNPGPLSSADGVLLSEFPENIGERGFGLSNCAIPTEENGFFIPEEAVSLVQSIANAYDQEGSSSELQVPLSPTKLADTGMDENEEFEDVQLEDIIEETKLVDCWKDAKKGELALISHQATKNRSYKKKLRDVFNSNFYSLKKKSSNHDHGAIFNGAANVDLVKGDITAASSVSSRGLESKDLSTRESCEPDWEFL